MSTSTDVPNIKDKRKSLKLQAQLKSVDNAQIECNKNFLTIESALPCSTRRRSHSSLNTTTQNNDLRQNPDSCHLYQHRDGSLHVSRSQNEKEKLPDRLCLDRRGLSSLPVIENEPRLRLLSLQHNLLTNLDDAFGQEFPFLVFLDIYDNQLERISGLDRFQNLRVLLMGKNRIRKIENMAIMNKLEVLDLHGNLITQIEGLTNLTQLKVLNLAGNQIQYVGESDLKGLESLQEFNLRRNKLKKLGGFNVLKCLSKVFLSNNNLQRIEDIVDLVKCSNIKEVTVDANPVSLAPDCNSFIISYLPQLIKLNSTQITDQMRKSAMAWRRNQESSNHTFMNLSRDICFNENKEEIILNARTNWELLQTQSKCLPGKTKCINKGSKTTLKLDSDIVLTSLNKGKPVREKSKGYIGSTGTIKVPLLPDKKFSLARSSSQDTENSQNTSSSNNSSEFFRLPPILVPIINKMEKCDENDEHSKGSNKITGSLSSIGPNVDSSVSSLSTSKSPSSSSSSSSSSDCEEGCLAVTAVEEIEIQENQQIIEIDDELKKDITTQPKIVSFDKIDLSSNISSSTTNSNKTNPSTSGSDSGSKLRLTRPIKSATNHRNSNVNSKLQIRASTAKPKKQSSPVPVPHDKDIEQGGDYLIEICGRHLNIYGQGALRFIDKKWNASKSNDVQTIKFNYVNFNSAIPIFHKIKNRFPNAENFIFKETNITFIGQLNALAELQGLSSLFIDPDGNPIVEKNWRKYATFRLSHWGLKMINNEEITENEIQEANSEYQSLTDLVIWSLPEQLLEPLLARLHIDVNRSGIAEQSAKKWLLSTDSTLKYVVSKEALQWKRGSLTMEETTIRHRAKQHFVSLLEEMTYAANKLKLLEAQWPQILHEFTLNTLLDYSQMDLYMKQKLQELINNSKPHCPPR